MVTACLIGNINDLQRDIMLFVDDWAREVKTPIPLSQIKRHMIKKGVKIYTIKAAVRVLIKKGYIRRAVRSQGNTTAFVQLRRV